MPPEKAKKSIPLADLLSAEASRMSQGELRRFRGILAEKLPEVITTAAEKARGGDIPGA
jgi:hypothetical protein